MINQPYTARQRQAIALTDHSVYDPCATFGHFRLKLSLNGDREAGRPWYLASCNSNR